MSAIWPDKTNFFSPVRASYAIILPCNVDANIVKSLIHTILKKKKQLNINYKYYNCKMSIRFAYCVMPVSAYSHSARRVNLATSQMVICPFKVPHATILKSLDGENAKHSMAPFACTIPTGPEFVQNNSLPKMRKYFHV